MTYEEALAYWFRHVNYELRPPEAADLKLDRMRALLACLGNPHQRLRILHIAGSKGKGSTSALLATILQRAGYRTGLFTSPHLSRLEERFQINGQLIEPNEVAELLSVIRISVEQSLAFEDRPPTFFELTTALGLLHFLKHRCEAVVLEVGLGGRLDSTNVCQPVVAVITSISYDHTRILGDRLEQIAWEKAGIIKPGRPVVSGVTAEEARAVIEQVSEQRQAPLRQLGRDFTYRYEHGRVRSDHVQAPRVSVQTSSRAWPALSLNLLGEHQAANAALAVVCVEVLREQGWRITDQAVAAGLAEVVWPARLEVIRRQPLVVVDCAHNVASAEALLHALEQSFAPRQRLLLFASSSDKDVAGMFRVLGPHFAQAVLTRYTNNPRAMPPEQLGQLWKDHSPAPALVVPNPAEALQQALTLTGADDLLCIAGSVFLAGELRPLLLP